MVRKFLTCVLLMVIGLLTFSEAEAKSKVEFKNLTAYQLDDENFRIEAEFKGNLSEDDITAKVGGSFLTLDIDNATPGRISRISGVTNNAKDFFEKIFVGTTKQNQTRMNFSFAEQIEESSVEISIQPANKVEKKSARLVIDFKKFSQKNNARKDEDAIGVDDRVIVIDAGHGGSDSGAVGHYGVKEKDVTLYVALRVEELLKASGAKVIMTRRTDIDVASPTASNPQELQARVNKCPPNTDIFISIHCNAFSNPNSKGMETYYYRGSPQSRRLAVLLNEELARSGGRLNRGVRTANFYVLHHNPHPASLIELAFITNYEEENLLANDDYQDTLAKAIVRAIDRYFNE